MPEQTAPLVSLAALSGRTFDAVLFDMDGTLIDSMAGSLRAWAAWAQEHGVDPAELATVGGRPAAQVVPALLAADRVAAAIARIEQMEVDIAADGIDVLPGTVDALAALLPDRVAIVTSCTRQRLGVDPARCLAVEDAPAGLASARAAGCTTLAVGDTHTPDELDADAHAPDLSHVRFTVTAAGITVTPA